MILRKQTVWLLTMLAVMVVLSGYYLVKGPSEQVPALGEEKKQSDPISGVEVESKQTDNQLPDATPVEGKTPTVQAPADSNTDAAAPDSLAVTDTTSEIFQGYKMKRDALLQQQKDEQLAIMSSDATPQAVAEAKAKFDELSNLENATLTLEEMLKASGYKDAVVSVQDNKATVIVQKDKLDANEVVNIIAEAKQHLNIPATNITVQFKAS